MTYRAPLIKCDTHTGPHYYNFPDPEILRLLTDAQWAWFARVSQEYGIPVDRLMRQMQPIAEQEGDANTVRLLGLLPSCGLYGCLASDGRTHT